MGLVLRHLVSSQFRHLPLQLVTFTEQGPDGATRYSERAEQDKGADIHSCSCRRLRRLAVGLRLAAPLLLRVAAVHVALLLAVKACLCAVEQRLRPRFIWAGAVKACFWAVRQRSSRRRL